MELYKSAYKRLEGAAASAATIFSAFVLVYAFAVSIVHPGRVECSNHYQIGCQTLTAKLANPSDTFSIVLTCILMVISLLSSVFVIFSSGSWSFHRRLTKVVSLISVLAVILGCFMVFAPYAHRAFVAPLALVERSNYAFSIVDSNITLSVSDSNSLFEKADVSHAKLVVVETGSKSFKDRGYLVRVDPVRDSNSGDDGGILVEPEDMITFERPVPSVFSLAWTVTGLKENTWYVFFLAKVTSDGKYEVPAVVEAPSKTLANGEDVGDKKLLVDVRPFRYCFWANGVCNDDERA